MTEIYVIFLLVVFIVIVYAALQTQKNSTTLLTARFEGFKECEDMVTIRIKQYYPNQIEELHSNLLQ